MSTSPRSSRVKDWPTGLASDEGNLAGAGRRGRTFCSPICCPPRKRRLSGWWTTALPWAGPHPGYGAAQRHGIHFLTLFPVRRHGRGKGPRQQRNPQNKKGYGRDLAMPFFMWRQKRSNTKRGGHSLEGCGQLFLSILFSLRSRLQTPRILFCQARTSDSPPAKMIAFRRRGAQPIIKRVSPKPVLTPKRIQNSGGSENVSASCLKDIPKGLRHFFSFSEFNLKRK